MATFTQDKQPYGPLARREIMINGTCYVIRLAPNRIVGPTPQRIYTYAKQGARAQEGLVYVDEQTSSDDTMHLAIDKVSREVAARSAGPRTIRVNGRDFTVEVKDGPDGLPVYHLKGKRGAHYFTMRNKPNPSLMFVCDARRFGCASTMEGVWLTDEGGDLREVSA